VDLQLDERPEEGMARLVVIVGDEEGQMFDFAPGRLTVGRHREADIRLGHLSVSRMHAEIVNAGGWVSIKDLTLEGGVRLNDERVSEAVLAHGDFIEIGRTVFQFLTPENPQ